MFRYISLMFKNSLRNKRRSVLTILSIGASLCLLGLLGALYRGLFLAPPMPGQELRIVTRQAGSMLADRIVALRCAHALVPFLVNYACICLVEHDGI